MRLTLVRFRCKQASALQYSSFVFKPKDSFLIGVGRSLGEKRFLKSRARDITFAGHPSRMQSRRGWRQTVGNCFPEETNNETHTSLLEDDTVIGSLSHRGFGP